MKLQNIELNNIELLIVHDILELGVNKSQLYKFLEENNYEKVAHGIYVSKDAWVDEEYILSLRYPNAIFSHDVALYYHGLVDREPLQPVLTVYTGFGTARLIDDGVKVYTIKKDLLDIGKTTINNHFSHQIPIYDLERTICDLVRSRNNIEIQDYTTALKTYIRRKDKDLNKLMEYAKLFHIDKKMKEYLEVLL